jgi:hypothetical protein
MWYAGGFLWLCADVALVALVWVFLAVARRWWVAGSIMVLCSFLSHCLLFESSPAAFFSSSRWLHIRVCNISKTTLVTWFLSRCLLFESSSAAM